MALALLAGQALHGQSAYFQAVTNLNPAGYWPLGETVQPPAAFANSLVATNIGSVGAAGDGYYGAWYQPFGNTWYLTNNVVQSNGITFSQDGDKALWCTNQPGQYVIVPRTTNGVYNPAVTIVPPMSIEVWVVPTYTGGRAGTIISEGEANLNYGGPNTNNPYYGGLGGPGWAGFVLGQYQNYFFFNYYMTNAESKANEVDSPHASPTFSLVTNNWNHIVCTFDGSLEAMWVNGVEVKTVTHAANAAGLKWVPDLTTPLLIGTGGDVTANGGGGLAAYTGVIDEVAIYNQVLPQTSIQNHYMAGYGTNSGGGAVSYTNVVQSDNPTFYFRLDESEPVVNGGYASATYPVASNYGTLGAAANGVYQPGTTPGVAGPPYVGFGGSNAVALNGFLGAVDVGGGSLPAALNPTGTVPLTVVSWFQGGPADAPARLQDILGHGPNSYRLALDGNTLGSNGAPRFNPGASIGPELQFANATDMVTNHAAFNDGNWHMVAGVTDGTNAYMYLDGNLVKSSNSVTGINIVGSTADLLLGGDPLNTAANANTGDTDRTFDGQIAQAAIWTTALTTGEIQSLYNAAGVPPSIVGQPVGATNNQGANLTVTATAGGSQPISFQWYTNGTPVAGQTNENLSYAPVTTNAIGDYYLVATSPYGSATSLVAQVYVYGLPSVLTESQASLQVYAGENPVLALTAAGAPTITYQWLSNSVAIAGATANSYTVANAQDSATYTCNVTNIDGAVLAGPFTLTVLADPTAPYPAAVLAANPIAFWRLDESSGISAYDYVGGFNGTYTNVTLSFAPPYNATTDPMEGYAPGFAAVGGVTNNSYVGWIPTNINFATPTNANAEFSVECWLQEYLVYTDNGIISLGYGSGGEEFALDCGGNDPAHDLRFYVRNAGGTSSLAVSGVSPANGAAWHHVVGVCDEANGHVYLYVDGTNAGSAAMIVKSGVLTSTQSLTIGARQEGNGTQYDNQFVGAIDEVAVYNYALSAAQVQSHYYASGIAPIITQVTSSETTNVGSTAVLTVAAAGTPTLFYQWYDPNNNPISTNATLTLSNVQSSAAGNYTIVVSNLYGTATSYSYLQVDLGPPQIAQDIAPLMQTLELYAGLNTVTFSVSVSGSAPFEYQWYQGASQISGATNSNYTFTGLPGTNTYYVTITNAYTASQAGGVPAQSSTATVIGVPTPQLNPSNYAYRAMISFPGYDGQPLTNFPALITLSPSTIPGLAYAQFAANGSDLRFTDASGKGMLPFEIDEWNDGGLSTVWVEIPLLNGTNIWAYWGNPADADVAPAASNVWLNAGYEIVYHLKEGAFPFADSTGQYPATNGVAPAAAAGVVGHGGTFDGSTVYITPGPVTLSNQFTASAWIYINPSAANEQSIWVNQHGGYGLNGFSWFVDSYQTSDRENHVDSGNGAGSGNDAVIGTVTSGQWHLMVATWDQPDAKVTTYVDGSLTGSGTYVSTSSLTNELCLGAFLDPTLFFSGVMDEARIQYGLASTNWIWTSYLNMSESSFVSYSSVNLQPALTIATSTNGYVFSWPTNDGTFTLETTANIAPPATWTPVTIPAPAITNGVWQQIVQPVAGSHFYRLQGQ